MLGNTVIITGTQVGNNDIIEQNQQLKERITYITITNKVIGKGWIRIIGSENYRDCPSKILVDIYQAIISDNFSNKRDVYGVSRDAPIINVKNPTDTIEVKKIFKYKPWYDPFNWFGPHYEERVINKKVVFNIINTSFEPKSDTENMYIGRALAYPPNSNLEAYALKNMGTGDDEIDAEPIENPIEPRKNKNKATGVMIHVGGDYTNNGINRMVGSFGCFGVFLPKEGNSGIKSFVNNVVSRKTSKKRIIIIKRKTVRWKFQIDKKGNIIQ